MGDFNSGPACPSCGVEAKNPAAYERILSKGFESANAVRTKSATWDPRVNTLITDPTERAHITSHVFTKPDQVDANNPKLFWNYPSPVETPNGVVDMFPSDHFASRVTITWPAGGLGLGGS